MPHSLVLIFGDTVRAAEAFDRHMPTEVPRIVLVDTFRDEAEESLRVEPAENQICVGNRGLLAPSVADRSGIGSRRLGTDTQHASGIEARDRSAACARGVNVQHGHADRHARNH